MISEQAKKNFEIIIAAVVAGEIALVEYIEQATGEPAFYISLVHEAETGDYLILPVANVSDPEPWTHLEPID